MAKERKTNWRDRLDQKKRKKEARKRQWEIADKKALIEERERREKKRRDR